MGLPTGAWRILFYFFFLFLVRPKNLLVRLVLVFFFFARITQNARVGEAEKVYVRFFLIYKIIKM